MNPNLPRIRALADTLLSGEYRQGRLRLRPSINTYCCLGVACDLIDKTKWRVDESEANIFTYGLSGYDLPSDVIEYYGIDLNLIPAMMGSSSLDEDAETSLAALNDGGWTFQDLAAVLYSFCDAVESGIITPDLYEVIQ